MVKVRVLGTCWINLGEFIGTHFFAPVRKLVMQSRSGEFHRPRFPHGVPLLASRSACSTYFSTPGGDDRRDGVDCSDVDRLEGHCSCCWSRVKVVFEQRLLLICEGQWHTSPFERAWPEGWSRSYYRCVRLLLKLFRSLTTRP